MKKIFSLLLISLLTFNLFIPIQIVAQSDIDTPGFGGENEENKESFYEDNIQETTGNVDSNSTELEADPIEIPTDTNEDIKEKDSNVEDNEEKVDSEKETSNEQKEIQNTESEKNNQFINKDSDTEDTSVEDNIYLEKDNRIHEDKNLKQEEPQEEGSENNIDNVFSAFSSVEEIVTSRLGHLRGGAKIYPNLHDQSSYKNATDGYTNAVYYVKRKAVLGEETYYLISTKPSSTNGVIGWVKEKEIDSRTHSTIDNDSKKMYIKGTGSAYSKAWGGAKDLVYSDMSNYKHQIFNVDLTESVGNNTWYRGTLNGKTVWLHSSSFTTKKESNVSRLGHLRGGAKIYPNLHDQSSYKNATDGYTNAVYYVKRKAVLGEETYYLISTKPSSTNGVIGWVKEKEIDSRTHRTIDSNPKTLYIKGTGSAYSKAWGGSKDLVYSKLSGYSGTEFQINLTEEVGNNTWYRGKINGRTAWIHESYLTYSLNLTLNEAVNIQMTASPQTDYKYRTYVSKTYINNQNEVTAETLNVRGGPNTNYWVVGQLKKGSKVTVIRETNGWYEIEFAKSQQWVNASPNDVLYYLNPNNFINDSKQQYQFLDLSRLSGASVSVLNNYLNGKGTLDGQAEAFINAGNIHGVNEVYLISHAILETGHGTSKLASGIKYNGVTVYNMYGIGAYDHCPNECGAKTAYEQGWTTPSKAIIGGAKFIGESYIHQGQNTLYKMRWNPVAMSLTGRYGKQYATDIGWASKQVNTIYNLYQELGLTNLYLDIPVYKR